jgi:hypothetical protein
MMAKPPRPPDEYLPDSHPGEPVRWPELLALAAISLLFGALGGLIAIAIFLLGSKP